MFGHSVKNSHNLLINQFILLVVGLVCLPVQASDWLLRAAPTLKSPFLTEQSKLFQFSNGDNLYQVAEEELPHYPLSELIRRQEIRYLEPVDSAIAIPLVPNLKDVSVAHDFLQQDGFERLNDAQRACDLVTIAIIDSGVDVLHPNLNQVQFVFPYNAITDQENSLDDYGHGTHVAGLVAATATELLAIQGVCRSAKIMPIRFLDQYGAGSVMNAIKGVRWAIEHNANIINHSWTIRQNSQALADVIAEADAQGIVQIAAAGNVGQDNDDGGFYPANYAQQLPGLIAVANWDSSQTSLYHKSNYGLTSVDVAASGTELLSLAPNASSQRRTGTSMSAPLVSALAAMLLQQQPELSAAAIKAQILTRGQPELALQGKLRTSRRIDANNTLNAMDTEPAILAVIPSSNGIELKGVHLKDGDVWRYQTAQLPPQHITLFPMAWEEQSLFFPAIELPMGYWQLIRNDELVAQTPYKPQLSAPSSLQVVAQSDGNVVSWQGSDMAHSYEIQAAQSGQGFVTLATVVHPVSHYFHPVNGIQGIRYRVRASYDYQFNGQESPLTKDSPYSTEVESSRVARVWQRRSFAEVPRGRRAILPLQLEAHADGELQLLDDAQHLVAELDSQNRIHLNTSVPNAGQITLRYQNGNNASEQTFSIQIKEQASWRMPLSAQDSLTIDAVGFELQSVQQLRNGHYLLSGYQGEGEGVIVIRLDSAHQEFSMAEVTSSSAPELEVDVLKRKQQFTLVLAAPPTERSVNLTLSLLTENKLQQSDSRCFIASELFFNEPEKILKFRQFRDDGLLKLPFGEAMVQYYYQHSPVWVNYVRDKPNARMAMRFILNGLLWSPQWGLVLCFGFVGIRLIRNAHARARASID